MNFFKTVWTILLYPKDFFNELKEVKGIKNAFIYLLIFTLFTNIFVTINYYTTIFKKENFQLILTTLGYDTRLNLKSFFILYFILTPTVILLAFLRPIITHIFIKSYGGKKRFSYTYNAMTYALTPAYVATPFFVITLILLSLNLTIFQFKLKWILLFLSIILWIVPGVYTVYLRTTGVAEVQEISNIQSFLSIYVFGILFLFILGIIFLGIPLFAIIYFYYLSVT